MATQHPGDMQATEDSIFVREQCSPMPLTGRQRKAGGKYVSKVLNYSLYLYRREKIVGIYARLPLPAEPLPATRDDRANLKLTEQ